MRAAFSRLSRDERVYSPPFYHGGIAFMLLLFPRGNQQREYASLYVSVADKTKLPAGWRRNIHFALSVIDQRESLCSVTKSTHGELTTQVLDWGFTELLPLATRGRLAVLDHHLGGDGRRAGLRRRRRCRRWRCRRLRRGETRWRREWRRDPCCGLLWR